LDLPQRFVLYGGSVLRSKGVMTLAEAARGFLAEDPQLHLVFIGPIERDGDQPLNRAILDTVGTDLANRVHFPGRQDRWVLFEAMKRAEVFAFPSPRETFGLVIAEAMLAGTPTIACSQPPMNEIITDGQTGLLATAGNAEEWDHAVRRLLHDQNLAARLGAAGRQHVQASYTVDSVVEQSLAFYAQTPVRH
jgi:glycosyltransferase involved in cell wall biosynthesis